MVHNVYMNGNKVFNLYRGKPIAAMTAGLGNIGKQSISVLSKDLRALMMSGSGEYGIDPSSYTIEECAIKCRKFFFEDRFMSLKEEERPTAQFDYWIGGYSSDSLLPELWKISIEDGDCSDPELILDKERTSIAWGGQPEAIGRLVLGYGQGLAPALQGLGIKPEDLGTVMDHLASQLAQPLIADAMPTQDAVDLAEFLVHTTKMYVRFLPGANTVGGKTDVAAITKHEGFKWVERKHYYPAELNPG